MLGKKEFCMYCNKCGSEIKSNASFCTKCGNRINDIKDISVQSKKINETLNMQVINSFLSIDGASKSKILISTLLISLGVFNYFTNAEKTIERYFYALDSSDYEKAYSMLDLNFHKLVSGNFFNNKEQYAIAMQRFMDRHKGKIVDIEVVDIENVNFERSKMELAKALIKPDMFYPKGVKEKLFISGVHTAVVKVTKETSMGRKTYDMKVMYNDGNYLEQYFQGSKIILHDWR